MEEVGKVGTVEKVRMILIFKIVMRNTQEDIVKADIVTKMILTRRKIDTNRIVREMTLIKMVLNAIEEKRLLVEE